MRAQRAAGIEQARKNPNSPVYGLTYAQAERVADFIANSDSSLYEGLEAVGVTDPDMFLATYG